MVYKYDVFISYSSKDYLDKDGKEIPGNVISMIEKLFQNNGVKYWISQEENMTGRILEHTLYDRILDSQLFLFVCSKNAAESQWAIKYELKYAHTNKKMIIPFICDDSYINEEVSKYITPLVQILYYKNKQKALEDLITCVKTNITVKEKKQPVFTKIQMDDHWGFANEAGKIVVPCIYNAVSNYQEGLACVESDKRKWGFVDEKGNEIIPCKWEDVGLFSEGLAYAEDAFGRIGFIDKKGKVVIQCQWEDVYPFFNGKAFVKDANGSWLRIDKAGNAVE